MANVMDRETAERELLEIGEILDAAYQKDDAEKIIPAIQAGRFVADAAKGTVTYVLLKPIELLNGGTMDRLVFRSPTVTDIEYINKGFLITTDGKSSTTMDLGAMQARVNKAVVRLSGLASPLLERMSRADMRVLTGLFNFFD